MGNPRGPVGSLMALGAHGHIIYSDLEVCFWNESRLAAREKIENV